jgi:hypothetical protein
MGLPVLLAKLTEFKRQRVFPYMEIFGISLKEQPRMDLLTAGLGVC